jgi:hypothetical protein
MEARPMQQVQIVKKRTKRIFFYLIFDELKNNERYFYNYFVRNFEDSLLASAYLYRLRKYLN